MRILVVDDESLNRFLLVHMLEEAGYTDCYEAETGREALQLAKRIQPDLILLDVMMPDMNGYEVAPLLKKMAGGIYLPIIFITSLDDQEALARCLEVGGDDFASKPFDKTILTAKIRAHARTRLLSRRTFEQNKELTYFRNGVEREHAIVEHIFSNVLSISRKLSGFFDYRLAPASSFNGDLFLIETSPSGGMYFLVGDFTGHGLASAIGALPVAKAFQAMAKKGVAVSEMAYTLNSTLLALLPVDMFFASVIVEISANGRHFTVWNGAMPDFIVLSPEGEVRKRFSSLHMAMGILDNHEFEDDVEYFEAQMGDRLIGYSDGVIELTNVKEQMLGEDALMSWLSADPCIRVAQLNEKIEAFRGNAEQLDDITLVSYTCQSLEAIRPEYVVTPLPFEIHICMQTEQLKTFDPVMDAISMLASQKGMQSVRSDVSTVLSELFNNSLDHGILGLDSNLKKTTEGFFDYFNLRMERLEELEFGQIDIYLRHDPNSTLLQLTVVDSGKGFEYDKVVSAADSDSFGRGIPLIKELSNGIVYSEDGKRVDVTFSL